MQSTVGINAPQAVKRWSTALAVDYQRHLYFKKFIATGDRSIIEEKVELKTMPGDTVYFDLAMRKKRGMVTGDSRLEGKETAMRFLQDQVSIDQARSATSAGGRMTRQRTLHDFRRLAKDREAEFCAEWADELITSYLSGVGLGTAANEDTVFDADDGATFATNPIEAPDAAHLFYGGDATGKADLAANDIMSTKVIERVNSRAKMLNARNPNVVAMQPLPVDSSKHFVMLMNPEQHHDLRTSTANSDWLEITKQAGVRGKDNPIFTGALGHYAGVALHEHTGVRRFTDYGPGSNVEAARALFLGRQAGVIAYGQGSGKSRMTWVERDIDYGNEVGISAGMIVGFKKSRFKTESGVGSDFGCIAVDTAARAA